MSLSLSLFLFPPLLPLYCLIWAVLPHWTLKKRHAYVRAIPPPKKPPTTRYATHAFKCILMEPNRRNAVVLLVTGKFTVKLQMESILWSSFTVVSGKWELCFHGHKLSNSFFFFTERKIPELPCAFEMFVVSLPQTFVTFHTTITGQRRVQFQLHGLWETHIHRLTYSMIPVNRKFPNISTKGKKVMTKLHYWLYGLFI